VESKNVGFIKIIENSPPAAEGERKKWEREEIDQKVRIFM
jgi:hypothetical protein